MLFRSINLHIPKVKREHKIDYLGAAVMVSAVVALLLAISVYGPEKGWTAPATLTSFGIFAALTILFLIVEASAKEPILPFDLFKNHTVSITSLLGFIIGAGMFGAIVMVPLYLQIVKSNSATMAGLKLIPFMLGIVSMSIYSGKQISKHGHYKRYPIIGLILMSIGIGFMSTLDVKTP